MRLVGQEFCDILVDRGWLKARASSDSTVSSEDYANMRNESLEEDLNCVEQAFRIEEEDSRDSESWKKPLGPHLFPAFSDGTTASHTEVNSKNATELEKAVKEGMELGREGSRQWKKLQTCRLMFEISKYICIYLF